MRACLTLCLAALHTPRNPCKWANFCTPWEQVAAAPEPAKGEAELLHTHSALPDALAGTNSASLRLRSVPERIGCSRQLMRNPTRIDLRGIDGMPSRVTRQDPIRGQGCWVQNLRKLDRSSRPHTRKRRAA